MMITLCKYIFNVNKITAKYVTNSQPCRKKVWGHWQCQEKKKKTVWYIASFWSRSVAPRLTQMFCEFCPLSKTDWDHTPTHTVSVGICMKFWKHLSRKICADGDFLVYYCYFTANKKHSRKNSTFFYVYVNVLWMSVILPLFILWDGWSHILVFLVIPRRYLFEISVFQLAPLVWEQIQLYTRDGLYICLLYTSDAADE